MTKLKKSLEVQMEQLQKQQNSHYSINLIFDLLKKAIMEIHNPNLAIKTRDEDAKEEADSLLTGIYLCNLIKD